MDSKDNFLRKMRELLLNMDDEYLIGVSNKGLVNRGKKDLDEIKEINIEIQDSNIKAILPDGTMCIINENIKEYNCSCPSRTVCKHVIIAYLYLKNNLEDIFPCETKSSSDIYEIKSLDFSRLLNITKESFVEMIGEKSFNEIVKRLHFEIEAEIEESSLLTIKFKYAGEVVKFTPITREESSDLLILTEGFCSCKSSEVCSHKVEALLHYQLYKGIFNKEELTTCNKKSVLEVKKYMEAVSEVKRFMEDILFVGLSRLPETTLEKLETISIVCHNANIPNLEKMIRTLRTELELYIKKNASFSISNLRDKLSNIYAVALAIENSIANEKIINNLCGEHKSTYFDIPPIIVWGIGAEAWNSKSGYEGVTYYFFEESRCKLFTFTNSRPTFYDNNSSQNPYREVPSWGISENLEEISRCGIRLTHAKINEEARISSSEQTKGNLLEKTDIHKLNFKNMFIDNWSELLQGFTKVFIRGVKSSVNIYILKPKSFGKSSFDNIKQRFTLPMYDINENAIYITLNFSDQRQKLIQKLERMERLKRYPESILGSTYIIEGILIVIPITAYYEDGTILNLTL